MVDSEDYPKLIIYEWRERKGKYGSYAVAKVTPEMKENYYFLKNGMWENREPIGMQYLIIGKKNGHIIDHRNHNGLDNQKRNIRHATYRQNNANQRVIKRKGEFKGVEQRGEKFRAVCDRKYLGSFDSPVMAAEAYDREAAKRFGEFACLNCCCGTRGNRG